MIKKDYFDMKSIKEIRKEIDAIIDQHTNLINSLIVFKSSLCHNFTKEELINNGWVYDSYYGPGDESMWSKGNKLIRIPKDNNPSYILTYDGYPMRRIEDLDDLNEYASK